MLLGPLAFILGRRSSLFSKTSGLGPGALCLVLAAPRSPWLWLYLRWSALLSPMWLVELGALELPTIPQLGQAGLGMGSMSWLLFEGGSRQRLMVFSIGPAAFTAEAFFRNARWLEREAGEMTGLSFTGKRDRRTLFGLPVFYSNPLRKAFPVGGVFDLGLCPLTHKLVFRHVSWLS